LEFLLVFSFLSFFNFQSIYLLFFISRVFEKGLVVHNELALHKVKGIAGGFVGVFDHFFDEAGVQFGDLINGLPFVRGIRRAKRKCEIELFDQLIPEKVLFDHPKVLDFLGPTAKRESSANHLRLEDLLGEVIPAFKINKNEARKKAFT
jgi:hypothetical protein